MKTRENTDTELRIVKRVDGGFAVVATDRPRTRARDQAGNPLKCGTKGDEEHTVQFGEAWPSEEQARAFLEKLTRRWTASTR